MSISELIQLIDTVRRREKNISGWGRKNKNMNSNNYGKIYNIQVLFPHIIKI